MATGVIAAIMLGFAIYGNRPISVQVAAEERNVPVRVFGLGTVEARVLSKIGFEVGAALAELHADHGDRVTKGQVLARLSLGEQEAKVAKARAALEIATVNITRAEANLEKAQAVLAQKQEANRRKQALVGRDIVSQQVAEEAVRDEAVAKADVVVAESEIASARAQLTDAKAQVQFEETLLRHRTLVAPYDAIVIERHKELGTVVKAGDPIFTLIAAGSYWGLAYVDEARAGFINEGQRVDARLRSRPQEAFTGKVERIGLESDRVTEERRVYIKGDNPPPRVFLGEQVEFWITVATLDEALLVPAAAVHGYDGRQGTVWTVEAGRLQRRFVKFRHRTEDARLEIVDGVPEGARVVVSLDSDPKEGRAVRVSEARPQ
ncbi:efflux RND transporter periplasmic adaptor subunit [Hyphomicrobium sp. DMF-1]|uniref:efflux RND transporter periplasmic adaptor subunit n=1 Tax=Hyphomicrobium sp. DMF-1 TaxID=3019544 RepID=UPI0022EBB339|nr:efflux RND transporter periplasmic adaptor subunit [Hyphomicrobium sp. DMF-1]WBT38035.1 efflux RND transporter periplasmic adaptor subunit [Hyphomicrobium sp. DMF-1]